MDFEKFYKAVQLSLQSGGGLELTYADVLWLWSYLDSLAGEVYTSRRAAAAWKQAAKSNRALCINLQQSGRANYKFFTQEYSLERRQERKERQE